ncbi:MAG: acyl-CoA dehydrogenase family protein [bacterium]
MTAYFTEEHNMFRKSIRNFAESELKPHADEWEAAEIFPKEIFAKFGKLGCLGIRFPEDYGGVGQDYWYTVILCEELAKVHCLGAAIGVLVQTEMATSSINEFGAEELKKEFLPSAISGEKIFALGITEPGFGSNAAGIQTAAKKDGGDYVINGAKTFISNGTRADFVTLAVRTGGPGSHGISLVVFPTDTKGFTVSRKLKKMGTKCGDLAELSFEDCRIPQRYLIGEDGKGFYYIMKCFQGERIVLASFANGLMELLLEEAKRYGLQREVFGTPVLKHGYWKQKYADMRTTEGLTLDAKRGSKTPAA